MKLAIYISHFSPVAGGAEGFAVSVVRELARREHRLVVIAEDGSPLEGVKTVFGDLIAGRREAEAFGAELHIDWGLNVPADLHRLGGATHAAFLPYAIEAYPVPLRWLKTFGFRFGIKHRRIRRRETELLGIPETHVLAVSNFVANQVSATASLPAECIHVLHNGVDTERFNPQLIDGERDMCRQELGLIPDDVAFLMVAHNLRLKNIDLMHRVFNSVSRSCPHVRLVLLGKHQPNFSAPWLIYAGASSRPERYYAAADAMVHPTYYDACANVVLEALASGLPVISSDRNGSAELMEHGRHGYILPVIGNRLIVRRQWEDAIRQLATESTHRTKMSKAARQLAQNHTLTNYVDQFEKFLANQILPINSHPTDNK